VKEEEAFIQEQRLTQLSRAPQILTGLASTLLVFTFLVMLGSYLIMLTFFALLSSVFIFNLD